MNILYYIITFFVLVYLTIKFKHRFWSIQPVFHIYNIFYWMFPPGIIQTKIPKLTKYYDPTIFHKNFNDVSEYEIDNVSLYDFPAGKNSVKSLKIVNGILGEFVGVFS